MRVGRFGHRGRVVVAVVIVALVAASCSDDSSSTGTTTTAGAVAPAPTPTSGLQAPAKFTFGFVAPSAPLLLDLSFAQENALSLAVADINAGGGVLGAPVKAVTTDDGVAGSVPNAVTNLVKNGADAILGPIGSSDAKAAIPALAGAKALGCSASATAPDLNTGSPQAAFYRTALPDQNTVQFVAQQILAQRDATAAGQPWKVVIVARGDDYGTSVSSGLAAMLSSQGVTASVISYLPEQTSLNQPATQAAAESPNTVVAVTYEEAPRLLDQLIGAGVPATKIIGLDAMFVPNLASTTFPSAPDKLNGLTIIGVTGDRAFMSRLAALPSGQIMFGPQLYDCAIVIALAAEAARSADPSVYAPKLNAVLTGTRPCSTYGDCRAKLAAGETVAYQGQIGSFTFDATKSPTASRFTVANLANGKPVVTKTVDLDLTKIQAQEAAAAAMAAAVQTARLQQALTALGLYSGPIDGVPSEQLTASIAALQTQLGVPATGVYDEATDAALRQRLGTASSTLTAATVSLQEALTELGFYHGPIDGVYSAATIAAVRSFQTYLGVPPTGVVDAPTVQAVYALGASSVIVPTVPTTTAPTPAPPPTTVPASPSTAPPTTAPPTTPTTPPSTTPSTTVAATTVPAATTTTAPSPPGGEADIMTTLTGDPRFATYVGLVEQAGLAEALTLLGPVTVFAPTNDAFKALPAGKLDQIRSDPAMLHTLLLSGMVEGRLTTQALSSTTSVTNLEGGTVDVAMKNGTVTVNGAAVVEPALDAANGIVHGLATVPGQGAS
jgi:branched-chain amino acid transport system substrate-binding protein